MTASARWKTSRVPSGPKTSSAAPEYPSGEPLRPQNLHLEGLGPASHRLPDHTEAQNAQGHAGQIDDRGPLPHSLHLVARRGCDAPRHPEQEAEGVLGHLNVVDAHRRREHDTGLR